MDRSRDIKHGEYTWHFEKADLEQGAYSVADPDRRKVAAILPADRSKPIEHGQNAVLHTRNFGTDEWKAHPACTLREAMTKGNEHIDRYRVQDQAAYTLAQIKQNGLSDETRGVIDDLRSRVAKRIAKRKTREEKQRGNDGGRERGD